MSVKVAVRCRPFNDREKSMNPKCCVKMVRSTLFAVSKSLILLIILYRMAHKQFLWINKMEVNALLPLTTVSGLTMAL